ncbi:MAG: dipeptidyl aminopeptidase [Paenibacillus sp.]|nr:dipeptidyl aminopeptidase [Paenibacillus sp.]
MAECIVYFEVHDRNGEVHKLRGWVMLEEGRKPTAAEVQEMLSMMGYETRIADDKQYEYEPLSSSAFERIIVKKMDNGEETFTPDPMLKALAESMMEKNRRSI